MTQLSGFHAAFFFFNDIFLEAPTLSLIYLSQYSHLPPAGRSSARHVLPVYRKIKMHENISYRKERTVAVDFIACFIVKMSQYVQYSTKTANMDRIDKCVRMFILVQLWISETGISPGKQPSNILWSGMKTHIEHTRSRTHNSRHATGWQKSVLKGILMRLRIWCQ